MQSTFLHSRLQLELLKKLREKKNRMQRGFTLVELMITVAIVGILSAVALPQFLNTRNAAQAGAKIGEGVGLAKECGVIAASDIGTAPSSVASIGITCDSAGGNVAVTIPTGAAGLRCLDATSASGSSVATINISSVGALSCAFT